MIAGDESLAYFSRSPAVARGAIARMGHPAREEANGGIELLVGALWVGHPPKEVI